MERKYGRTSFRDFTYTQLVAMLAAGRPADVRVAAEGWQDLANRLDDAALSLDLQHTRFQDYWQGPAARAHAEMVKELLDAVRQVAWTARRAGDQCAVAREALDRARHRMATLPSANAGQAAETMEELRDAYLNIQLPDVPAVADPPLPGPDGSPAPAMSAAASGRPDLLARFWRDGLVAAAGAPLPTYAPAPAFAGPVAVPAPGNATPPVPLTAVADNGSPMRLGGGSAGFGGGFGAADEPARAIGHSSLAPRIDPAAVASTVAGVAGVGAGMAAAAGAPMMGGFMPPMAGGGAGDLGRVDGRGAPPWLMETLTVFDATVEVVPNVVG